DITGLKKKVLEKLHKKENLGKVKQGIRDLSEKIKEGNFKTLGQYFWKLYKADRNDTENKIRGNYTAREEHYLHEFEIICKKQNLNGIKEKEKISDKRYFGLVKELHKAIFFQRPLKSQKGLVGKCTFEKNKPRCPISHPLFEKFRMLSFINNIKIKADEEQKLRPLTTEEKQKIIPKFFRKSKPYFNFNEIKKELGKENYFNYKDNFTVSGCPTSAQLKNTFGNDWENISFTYTTKDASGKSTERNVDVHDIWHILFSFDSVEKLKEYAKEKLKLDEKSCKSFSKIILKKDYAALSLKAIKKILPYLEKGLIYSHSVFMANINKVVDKEIWQNAKYRRELQDKINLIIVDNKLNNRITQAINGVIKTAKNNGGKYSLKQENSYRQTIKQALENEFGKSKWESLEDRDAYYEQAVADFIFYFKKRKGQGNFIILKRLDKKIDNLLLGNNDTGEIFCTDEKLLENLYHPSDIKKFKSKTIKNKDGKKFIGLGSPATPSVRNPMAMRSLFQLRKLINTLIIENKIDQNTKINIELARELNNSNKRIAIRQWQNSLEKRRAEYAENIKESFQAETGKLVEPTKDDILKYQLWIEQNQKCLYTGTQISVSDFIGQNPKYDIEHTLPRSQSEDNSQMNKTLCQIRFNRDIKKNRMPSQLNNHEEILQRIEHWKTKYIKLDKQTAQITRSVKGATTKEQKDRKIQKRHLLSFERNYLKGKYERFIMEEIPSGFKNSQIIDIGIISKYSREFLSSVFDRVYSVKGEMTAQYRKAWGLQESFKDEFGNKHYKPKDRSNHVHHCIDAIVIANMDKKKYDTIAHAWASEEVGEFQKAKNILSKTKPWETFTQDVKKIKDEIFIVHHTPDKIKIQSKKKMRKRGVIQRNTKGEIIYEQGDTIRGSLHQDTFYGAIAQNKDGKILYDEKEKIIPSYVIRKELGNLNDTNVKNIVDPQIRKIVENAILEKKIKFNNNGATVDGIIWQNKKKHIPLKKVRIYAQHVKNPIKNFKKHRDVSKYEYKRQFNVVNEENYCMAIYEGLNAKGLIKRKSKLVNMFDAGCYFKLSNCENRKNSEIVPEQLEGKELKYILTKGTMVIFYKENSDEIWKLSENEKQKRLYKIIGFEGDGRIQLRFHQTAMQQSSQNKEEMTIVKYMKEKNLKNSVVNFKNPVPWLRLSKENLNFIVQNIDFNITQTGNIEKC
ncbi:MAG: type II CRISPR RNA-guided endonuclease Cas9, partial [Candidatus Marinimicrobia bacterium]|nr:type II CRISPR RNA-guided endonuclease Cas9 [Candidatus Neomarinimicrobiota bacterium]